jgi:hypothetical protein
MGAGLPSRDSGPPAAARTLAKEESRLGSGVREQRDTKEGLNRCRISVSALGDVEGRVR